MTKEHLDKIQNILDEITGNGTVAGASCLVRQGGKEQGYYESGFADIDAGRKMSRNTICRMYSMTKPVTSAAVMMLLEEGLIDLYQPVSDIIPEFAHPSVCTQKGIEPCPCEVTIQNLLNMTGGLTYGGTSNEAEKQTVILIMDLMKKLDADAPLTTMDFVRRLGKIPLAYIPGTDYQYSLSADVLGAVVEKVSGVKFGEFLKKRIFDPLCMNDTGFYVPQAKQNRLAKMYGESPSGLKVYTTPHLGIRCMADRAPAFESGGAGLMSTIDDYMKFCTMLLKKGSWDGKQILQPKTVEFMHTAHINGVQQQCFERKMDKHVGYSYGNLMRIMTKPEEARAVGQKGEYGWDGWLGTFMFIDPVNDMTMVYMQQKADSGMRGHMRRIQNIIYTSL